MGVHHLGVGTLAAGLLVSLFSCLLLSVGLVRLAAIEIGPRDAVWPVALLLLSPFGYFFSSLYTEGLFFALVVGALLFARQDRFLVASVLALLAGATRVTGVLLLPALLVEAAHQSGWRWGPLWRRAWPTLLAPLGALGFGLSLWARTGSPFNFGIIETRYFGISPALPWVGFLNTWPSAVGADPTLRQIFLPEVIWGLLGLVACAIAWWRLRPAYATFMTLSWILTTSLSFWRSVPRYDLALFPILFLVVAGTRRWRWSRWVLVTAGGVAMAYGTSRFAQGYWLA